ncbi:nitroreductase family protein [Salinibacillus xinjiangensis]|uniref:Nitroreductase n=1 Tax=Salinibacillus xinjiangensis TaxID=1229268 RepID=A0A6G1X4G8_9BACI|nr:nitroreductase family protein [Salinibacillus xinjiangensis]MRG85819.1 nitroreductase [Salinibacillus xinjiangensis]
MNVKDAIEQRREITKYADKEITKEVLENVLDAAYKAPSGNNLLSREFILVTDATKLEQLSESTPFVPWLKEAKAAVVVTGRPDISKYWVQDASIASGFVWLAAVENGLGAAFGAIYHATDAEESEKRENVVKKALNLPDDRRRRVLSILGLGYPNQELKAKKMLPRESVVYYETM